MSIIKKLVILVTMMLLGIMVIGFVNYMTLNSITGEVESLSARAVPIKNSAIKLSESLSDMSRGIRELQNVTNNEDLAKQNEIFEKSYNFALESAASLAYFGYEDNRSALESLKSAESELVKSVA